MTAVDLSHRRDRLNHMKLKELIDLLIQTEAGAGEDADIEVRVIESTGAEDILNPTIELGWAKVNPEMAADWEWEAPAHLVKPSRTKLVLVLY